MRYRFIGQCRDGRLAYEDLQFPDDSSPEVSTALVLLDPDKFAVGRYVAVDESEAIKHHLPKVAS